MIQVDGPQAAGPEAVHQLAVLGRHLDRTMSSLGRVLEVDVVPAVDVFSLGVHPAPQKSLKQSIRLTLNKGLPGCMKGLDMLADVYRLPRP